MAKKHLNKSIKFNISVEEPLAKTPAELDLNLQALRHKKGVCLAYLKRQFDARLTRAEAEDYTYIRHIAGKVSQWTHEKTGEVATRRHGCHYVLIGAYCGNDNHGLKTKLPFRNCAVWPPSQNTGVGT